jgi:hypothetical protein
MSNIHYLKQSIMKSNNFNNAAASRKPAYTRQLCFILSLSLLLLTGACKKDHTDYSTPAGTMNCIVNGIGDEPGKNFPVTYNTDGSVSKIDPDLAIYTYDVGKIIVHSSSTTIVYTLGQDQYPLSAKVTNMIGSSYDLDYVYNSDHYLTRATMTMKDSVSIMHVYRTYTYSNGNLMKMQEFGIGPDTMTTVFEYADKSNSLALFMEKTINFSFDAFSGRPGKEDKNLRISERPAGSSSILTLYTYEFDSHNNVTCKKVGNGTQIYSTIYFVWSCK